MSKETENNCIDIRLEFDFKGELYTPTASIDLDEHIRRESGIPLSDPPPGLSSQTEAPV